MSANNPFVYDRPMESGSFCDRKDEISKIVRHVENHTNILIVGKRRFGKTTLIKHVMSHNMPENTVSVYVDLFSITSESDFVRLIALEIAKTIIAHDRVRKTIESFKKAIYILGNRIRFSADISGLGSITVELKPSEAKEALEDVLSGFHTWLKSKDLSGLVVFDEFQQIASVQKKYSIEARLRTIVQFHSAISYLFMGSKDHIIAAMFNNQTRPFYAQATPINVGALDHDTYWLWASKLLDKKQITLTERAVETLFEVTAGETRLNNQIMHVIYDGRRGSNIDAPVILKISSEIVRMNDAFVRMWFDKFPLAQKKALKLIALNRGKLYAAELMAQFDTEKGTIKKAIDALIKQDEVAHEGDGLIIKDRINELWVASIAVL
jgi:hypothetical protein